MLKQQQLLSTIFFLLVASFVFAQTKTDSITLIPQTQLNAAQR